VRLRKILNPDGEPDRYILCRHNSYQWNPAAPVDLDAANFENHILQARKQTSDERKRPYLEEAVKMYAGDYLHEAAAEIWVMPVTSYYKRVYLHAVEELHDIYARAAAYDDIIKLCHAAIQIEPYDETLHERLIHALLISGETASAKRQYRHIAGVMKKMFGAPPSEELQLLHNDMRNIEKEHPSDPADIKRSLESDDVRRGAYFCTSGTFKHIYQLDLRSEERLKFPLYLAIVTVEAKNGEARSSVLKASSQTLRQCLMRTLRKGDVVSQHTQYQFLVLLSAYRHKDAESALVRVKRMFAAEPGAASCGLRTDLFTTGSGMEYSEQIFDALGYNQ
jgi:DNA-binding SARP family transcriptional activator